MHNTQRTNNTRVVSFHSCCCKTLDGARNHSHGTRRFHAHSTTPLRFEMKCVCRTNYRSNPLSDGTDGGFTSNEEVGRPLKL